MQMCSFEPDEYAEHSHLSRAVYASRGLCPGTCVGLLDAETVTLHGNRAVDCTS